MCDFEKVGSWIIDEAKPGSESPYSVHSAIVKALRAGGYHSVPLEFVVLNYLERLAWARDYRAELVRAGYDPDSLRGKSWRELAELWKIWWAAGDSNSGPAD